MVHYSVNTIYDIKVTFACRCNALCISLILVAFLDFEQISCFCTVWYKTGVAAYSVSSGGLNPHYDIKHFSSYRLQTCAPPLGVGWVPCLLMNNGPLYPSTILVASRWIFLSKSTSFLREGVHACMQYSRCGFTLAFYERVDLLISHRKPQRVAYDFLLAL